MKEYRIVCRENFGGVIGRKKYEVQKRLFGFLYWYNFVDQPFGGTGLYDTIEEAEKVIEFDKVKRKSHVCKYL